MGMIASDSSLTTLGWREVVRLPSLGIPAIRAKLDTGARSSALHVVSLRTEQRNGVEWVIFTSDPDPDQPDKVVEVEVPVHDQRTVRASNGQEELRIVIRTRIEIGGRAWPADITLARRMAMRFRMLIGREALRGRVLVDPAKSYVAPPPPGATISGVRDEEEEE